MLEAGQKFRQIRERLGLRYRDVEEFSQQIADRRRNNEFLVPISRLSDIENRGAVPSIYKLYSLCAIYRLDLAEALSWYGADPTQLPADSAALVADRTHLVGFGRSPWKPATGSVQVPLTLDPGLDLTKTTFLSRFIQSWGVLPLVMLEGLEPRNYLYAILGSEDHFMSPILRPGSLLLIDESRRRVASSGWTNELDRPIYFLEHRDGWLCAWCSLGEGHLIAIPHPSSPHSPVVFAFPDEVDVLGQVVGVASRLTVPAKARVRS
ncbi:MAG: helix-turn-helix transcriptional regulator [Bryobacteraceae bacterium]